MINSQLNLFGVAKKVFPERAGRDAEVADLRHGDDLAVFGQYHDFFLVDGVGAVAFFAADEEGIGSARQVAVANEGRFDLADVFPGKWLIGELEAEEPPVDEAVAEVGKQLIGVLLPGLDGRADVGVVQRGEAVE